MSERVTTAAHDGVLLITLNRPEARNALNLETAQALATALDQINDDDTLRLNIMTGVGGTFCSGMDLKAFAATGQRPYVGPWLWRSVHGAAGQASDRRCRGLCRPAGASWLWHAI